MGKLIRYAAVTLGAFSFIACGYVEKIKGGKNQTPSADENKVTAPGLGESTGPGTDDTDRCGGNADCAGIPIVVSGMIVHKRGVRYTNNNDFVFTDESHAVLRFYFIEGADAPSETINEVRIPHITELPFPFAIPGDPAVIFQRKGDYSLQVEVHSRAGDTPRVGDLVNEVDYNISGETVELNVEVTGLETCGSEGGGGFCTSHHADIRGLE